MISFTMSLRCKANGTTTMKINQAGSDTFKDEISSLLACVILLEILIYNEHRFKITNSHVPKLNKNIMLQLTTVH